MTSTFRIRTVLLASVVATLAACDTPVSPSDHPEAGGVVILAAADDAVLAQVIGQLVPFAAPLQLEVGQSLDVRIRFLNADDPQNLALAFQPDADEGESLRVQIVDESVVAYDDHGDSGTFRALSAGQTTVTIDLMHGTHPDFESGELTIIVQ